MTPLICLPAFSHLSLLLCFCERYSESYWAYLLFSLGSLRKAHKEISTCRTQLQGILLCVFWAQGVLIRHTWNEIHLFDFVSSSGCSRQARTFLVRHMWLLRFDVFLKFNPLFVLQTAVCVYDTGNARQPRLEPGDVRENAFMILWVIGICYKISLRGSHDWSTCQNPSHTRLSWYLQLPQ